MSPDPANDRNNRPKRNKTELACDICRKRKSRCDGRRPACSHCENMGLECVYRPPLTSLETDTSVLARLSHLETRLQAIDQARLDSAAPTPAPENSVIKSWPKFPSFHHAAAHKMFHYWSQLRVNLKLNLAPLNFLRQLDDNDKTLFTPDVDIRVPPEIPLSIVIGGIESMFRNIHRLPFVLRHLFTYGGLTDEACLDLFRRYLENSPGHDLALVFNTQSAEELLLQTVALKHLAAANADHNLSQKADLSFRHVLQHTLAMQVQQSPQALPFKFLFVIILLYLYGRPFHALGLLQSFESLIHNASPNAQEDLAAKLQYEACLHQYFILESDILSEIDGIPSERLHKIAVALDRNTVTTPPNLFETEPTASAADDYQSQELQAHLRLRGYMNSILENFYVLQRAYCRPEHVARALPDIARRLDHWYWTLPPDMRFPRHPSAFILASNSMSDLMVRVDVAFLGTTAQAYRMN
ncbi:hypothetical protein, variant [Phialophora macrospora]|uniref:Zn(2)-C6 fungal-type domain-containing protein n=1 Tax=Phialophora macrospora TaxID=1851006 RepID=A0A0D2FYE0_9EURO|nr:hypothetical protein, variant [Phialophora macrospora]